MSTRRYTASITVSESILQTYHVRSSIPVHPLYDAFLTTRPAYKLKLHLDNQIVPTGRCLSPWTSGNAANAELPPRSPTTRAWRTSYACPGIVHTRNGRGTRTYVRCLGNAATETDILWRKSASGARLCPSQVKDENGWVEPAFVWAFDITAVVSKPCWKLASRTLFVSGFLEFETNLDLCAILFHGGGKVGGNIVGTGEVYGEGGRWFLLSFCACCEFLGSFSWMASLRLERAGSCPCLFDWGYIVIMRCGTSVTYAIDIHGLDEVNTTAIDEHQQRWIH